MPAMIEVTLKLKDYTELARLSSLLTPGAEVTAALPDANNKATVDAVTEIRDLGLALVNRGKKPELKALLDEHELTKATDATTEQAAILIPKLKELLNA